MVVERLKTTNDNLYKMPPVRNLEDLLKRKARKTLRRKILTGKKISLYLAGPGVFKGYDVNKIKDMCSRYGFVGLHPFDNEVDMSGSKKQIVDAIFDGNTSYMSTCDIIVSDMSPFRSKYHSDNGTSYEQGGCGQIGKVSYGYNLPYGTLRKKIGNETDERGYHVEDFDLPENLMPCISIERSGGVVLQRGETVVKENDLSSEELEDIYYQEFELILQQISQDMRNLKLQILKSRTNRLLSIALSSK